MKICAAQIRPAKGDIATNIERHKLLINLAESVGASAIFFPELSITGYEPELAQRLATNQNDDRFDCFQELSDTNNITIGLGVPTNSDKGIRISMVVFQPESDRSTYAKQMLHSDELLYFVNGDAQVIITVDGRKIAPAICYESLQNKHVENAIKLGADIYAASVAKSINGVNKARAHFPEVAKKYSIPVLMSNCVGFCDNFESAGQSSVWAKDGSLVGQLDDTSEGILIYDTEMVEVETRVIW